jgi:hypothetical protein
MVQSVLANLVQCQREYGIKVGTNGRLLDNQDIPLVLKYNATPMTRGCFRPLLNLITTIVDFFLTWLGWPTMEEQHLIGIAKRSFEALSKKMETYRQRTPTAEEANLLQEEREAYAKIREAARPIWERFREEIRTPAV